MPPSPLEACDHLLRLETRLIRKDGGMVWADCYVTLTCPIDDEPPTALAMVHDITSQKQSEALLEEQNARLSRVMETRGQIAAADFGLAEVARLVAERAKELTGSDTATVSILDEGEPPVQVVIGEAEATADLYVPLLHRGKEVGSLSLAKERGVTDEDRRILELLAILLASAVSDAAEREARRDQKEALGRFETIFEAAPIGIGLVSLDGRLQSTNSAMRDITGRSAGELARRSTVGYTVPEDIDEVVRLFTGMVEGQYDSYRHEMRLYAKNGEVVWVDAATALLRDADGKPRMAVAMAQNITKRRAAEEQSRESEARYRTLVEQLPLITHVDTPYSADEAPYVSPQIEEILGYSLEEWHASPTFFNEHLHPEDRDRVREAQRAAQQSAEPLELEYRFIAADGRVVWLKDSHTVVRDETGKPRYTQGFAIDVTAQKQGEEDREALLMHAQEQNERLRKLDRMKDEFIALVSHELRTPLTSICGYLELLLDDDVLAELPAAQLSWLEVIDRNAERLMRLVEDLLITAQASAGNLALEKGKLDIATIIAQAVQASTPVATARGIALNCSTEPLPVADGDRLRIGQVIDNLVSNALKFTPAGGTIDVRAYPHRSAVRIEVTDTGMGIAENEQAQLFDRFFRTARAQEQAIPGVGLGLSISKAIVEAHDGRLSVRSVEGVGTTFFVDLPAVAKPNWIVAA
jgi:PAS domain S-box-containing protein